MLWCDHSARAVLAQGLQNVAVLGQAGKIGGGDRV